MQSKGMWVGITDRLQIALSNGYDSRIVEQWLKLCPIEIVITESSDLGFSFIANMPRGIYVNVLGEEDSHKHFYANINEDIYSRLQLPRRKGFSIRFFISTCISDVELLNSEPIVIKPFREDQIIVGATKIWSISRAGKTDDMVTSDPYTIPEPLKYLVGITKEQMPANVEDVVYFRRRLNNALEVFNWYKRGFLSNAVKEYVQFSCGLIIDRIHECSSVERSFKRLPDWHAVFMDELFKGLSESFTQQQLDELQKNATEMANSMVKSEVMHGEEFTNSENEVDVLKFLEIFKTSKAYERCRSVLVVSDFNDLVLHQCKECSSEANYFRGTRIDAQNNVVDIWHVKCSACTNKLSRDKWNKFQSSVGLQWNKDNEGDYPISEAPGFDFVGMEIKDISAALKEFNALLAKVSISARTSYKEHPELDSNKAEIKLTNALAWAGYIAHQIKQYNISLRFSGKKH